MIFVQNPNIHAECEIGKAFFTMLPYNKIDRLCLDAWVSLIDCKANGIENRSFENVAVQGRIQPYVNSSCPSPSGQVTPVTGTAVILKGSLLLATLSENSVIIRF